MGGGGGLALNQLLVVDGRHRQPAVHRSGSHEQVQHVPRRDVHRAAPASAASRCACRRRARASEQIYFIGATNVPIDRLDPALIRPGRMGRHVWFRTPTKHDRLDIFDLYLDKVAHDPDLDTPTAARRDRADHERLLAGDDRAGLLDGADVSPTTTAASAFGWEDLVEAMTTIESGTAVGIDYVAAETRAVAIHEAGHAAAGHVYMKGAESTRLSIRMRGGSLGHHQALEKEERFSRCRSRGDRHARLDARRDGRRAGLLRRELERRRRRRPVRDGAGGLHGRRVRDGPAAVRARRRSTTRPTRRRAQRDHEALRGDRPPDHEPHERRRAVRRRTRSPASSATATSARSPRRSSARRTSRRTT